MIFEIEDNQTLVFSIAEEKWRGWDEYAPDAMVHTGSRNFSFSGGELWEDNDEEGAMNSFFGSVKQSELTVVCNADGGKIKEPLTIGVEAKLPPVVTKFMTEQPPDVKEAGISPYKNREGVFYAPVMRWGNSVSGKRLRAPWVYCNVIFNGTNNFYLRALNVGYKQSSGHEFI